DRVTDTVPADGDADNVPAGRNDNVRADPVADNVPEAPLSLARQQAAQAGAELRFFGPEDADVVIGQVVDEEAVEVGDAQPAGQAAARVRVGRRAGPHVVVGLVRRHQVAAGPQNLPQVVPRQHVAAGVG